MGNYLDEALGYELVGIADNGIEGLELCRQERPDLVVLDVKIPKMDGLELAQILKVQLPETRILMLSAMLDPVTISPAVFDKWKSTVMWTNPNPSKSLKKPSQK